MRWRVYEKLRGSAQFGAGCVLTATPPRSLRLKANQQRRALSFSDLQRSRSNGGRLFGFRREAVHVQLARVRLAIRQIRRAHPPHAQAHRSEAIQVPCVRQMLLKVGPPLLAHEAAPGVRSASRSSDPALGALCDFFARRVRWPKLRVSAAVLFAMQLPGCSFYFGKFTAANASRIVARERSPPFLSLTMTTPRHQSTQLRPVRSLNAQRRKKKAVTTLAVPKRWPQQSSVAGPTRSSRQTKRSSSSNIHRCWRPTQTWCVVGSAFRKDADIFASDLFFTLLAVNIRSLCVSP